MKERKSKLDEQAESLRQWFGIDHLSLQDAQARLKERGVQVSLGRLSTWWTNEQQKAMQAQVLAGIASGSQFCTEIDRQLGKSEEPELAAIAKLLKILILKLAAQGEINPEYLKLAQGLLKPVLEITEGQRRNVTLEQAERKLKLVEEAHAKRMAEARTVETASELTPEQKMARWKEIFAIG